MVENNKLIAAFLGWQHLAGCDTWVHFEIFEGGYRKIHGEYSSDKMLFSSSWDWLMPVIEKISKMNLPDSDNVSESWQPFPRTFGMVNEDNGDFMFRFNRHALYQAPTLIEAAYAAVIDFISDLN